jgi:hypothetical protein
MADDVRSFRKFVDACRQYLGFPERRVDQVFTDVWCPGSACAMTVKVDRYAPILEHEKVESFLQRRYGRWWRHAATGMVLEPCREHPKCQCETCLTRVSFRKTVREGQAQYALRSRPSEDGEGWVLD